MDNLSKPELLTLLSIMEGELEARDLVIEALRVSPRDKLTKPRRGSSPNPPVASGACEDTFAELCGALDRGSALSGSSRSFR